MSKHLFCRLKTVGRVYNCYANYTMFTCKTWLKHITSVVLQIFIYEGIAIHSDLDVWLGTLLQKYVNKRRNLTSQDIYLLNWP